MPPPDARPAGEVVAELDLATKVRLLSGRGFWSLEALPSHGLEAIDVADGPHGLRCQTAATDHLGLGAAAPATCFPTAAALGSSWDVALLDEVGGALGREAADLGVSVVLGPGLNIKRHPAGGRCFEYLSEDPFLSGTLATAMVRGVQRHGVGTSAKHFAVNNQESHRLVVDAVVDERTLREIYLTGFEMVVRDASPWTVMCSYNQVNGTYASEHRRAAAGRPARRVGLRRAGHDRLGRGQRPGRRHRRRARPRDALQREGLRRRGPRRGGRRPPRRGGGRPLRRAGRGAPPARPAGRARRRRWTATPTTSWPAGPRPPARSCWPTTASCPSGPRDGSPPSGRSPPSPATRGPGARRSPRPASTGRSTRCGSGSAPPPRSPSSPGYDPSTGAATPADIDEAVAAARGADVAVVFAGLPAPMESEGFDRTTLDLPEGQVRLIEAVAATPTPVVVVLNNGGVVHLPWADRVEARAGVLAGRPGRRHRGGGRPLRRRRARGAPGRERAPPRGPAGRRPLLPRLGPPGRSTARACTWGTGSTTAPGCRPASRSAPGSRTRPSPGPTSSWWARGPRWRSGSG